MQFDGREVANYILDYCEENNRTITNLSLQKIVYFCHVWSLIELKRPLVRHKFEAWPHGPVLQYLYHCFKEFDSRPITGRAKKLNPDTGQQCVVTYNFDDATENLLRRTIAFYSRLSAGQLVELSHAKGSPWDRVWNHRGNINPGMKIDDGDITDFYSKAPMFHAIQ